MSAPAGTPHEEREADLVPLGRMLLVLAVMLALGLAAVAWSWRIGVDQLPRGAGAAPPTDPRAAGLEPDLIDHAHAAREQREAQLRRLAGYGWMPGESGVAHIPLSEAMAAWLQREQERP